MFDRVTLQRDSDGTMLILTIEFRAQWIDCEQCQQIIDWIRLADFSGFSRRFCAVVGPLFLAIRNSAIAEKHGEGPLFHMKRIIKSTRSQMGTDCTVHHQVVNNLNNRKS